MRMLEKISRIKKIWDDEFFEAGIRCCEILEYGHGHRNSMKMRECVDTNNNPLPWYTYPAIEYIRQLDLSEKTVFEFGCGNSSLFWGKIAKKVISIDDDEEWYIKIKKLIKNPNEISLRISKEDYPNYINKFSDNFDIIIIDGKYRLNCAKNAVKKITPTGMIIVDNSDWYTNTCRYLRNAGLIQIDMTGFGPINTYTWSTSFFLKRGFDFQPLDNIQPAPGIGSISQTPPLDDYE